VSRRTIGLIFLSSCLSGLLPLLDAYNDSPLQQYMPGFLFSIAYLVWLPGKKVSGATRVAVLLSFSTLAYFLAMHVAGRLFQQGESPQSPQLLSFFLAGVTGAAILVLGLSILRMLPTRPNAVFPIVAAGGILGIPFAFLYIQEFWVPAALRHVLLYFVWQLGTAKIISAKLLH
jgi:hypothetical protein